MTKLKTMILSALAFAALISCTKQEAFDAQEGETSSMTFSFSVGDEKQTRAEQDEGALGDIPIKSLTLEFWSDGTSGGKHLKTVVLTQDQIGELKLPALISKINKERRNSKNYVLFLGSTDAESNQSPCLSLVQFQIDDGELVLSAYQRSSDANLGLPADIYHLYLMARQIDIPLQSITLNLGNVHIYENNIEKTAGLIGGDESVKFELNV